jgi:hypothetical protein
MRRFLYGFQTGKVQLYPVIRRVLCVKDPLLSPLRTSLPDTLYRT